MANYIYERTCENCGKVFTVGTRANKLKQTDRERHFCDDCVSSLTVWERKKILMNNHPEIREKYLEQKRQDFLRGYIKHKLTQCKKRALEKGLDFNLTEKDIIIPEKCPILEVPLVIGKCSNYEYSPSIDRIDNSKGYVRGNIQIISKKANSMKNCASYEELQAFCKNVLRYSLNITEHESNESEDKEPQS